MIFKFNIMHRVLSICMIISVLFTGGYCSGVTSSAQFLTLVSCARNAAMGQTGVANAISSSDLYQNPAGLIEITKPNLSLMHASWFADTSYQCVAFSLPIEKIGAFGFAMQLMSYGNISAYDITGLKTGELHPNDLAISAAYSTKLNNYIDVGATAKFISSTIKNSATTCAFDAGAIYYLDNYNLRLAVAARNFGGKLKYVSEEEALPEIVVAGIAYEVIKNLEIVTDVNFPTNSDVYFGVGGEYKFNLKKEINLACRAGYNSLSSNINGLNNVSAGFGISYKEYRLDYSFMPFGELGNANLLSVNIEF